MPPISGGTMAILTDGRLAVVDPHVGFLAIVDPTSRELVASVPLDPMDDAGRVIGDPSGHVHIVLRRTGELLSFDATLTEPTRRPVCGAPRGLVYDPDGDRIHVACASGELVTLPAAGGEPTRVVTIQPDLRDPVLMNGVLYVSVFRTAELLTLSADGSVVDRRRPATVDQVIRTDDARTLTPNVAWRTRAMDDGRILMAHQRSVSSAVDVASGGYGGGDCRTGVVETVLSIFGASGPPRDSGAVPMNALPFDAAYAPALAETGREDSIYVLNGANAYQAFVAPGAQRIAVAAFEERCALAADSPMRPTNYASAVAVEVLGDGTVVTQLTGGSALLTFQGPDDVVTELAHPSPIGNPAGFILFHSGTPSGVACASCHPEGGEDGHTWQFLDAGLRRTQTLLGGILETAPFHWAGDQATMADIMTGAFGERMGASVRPEDADRIATWIDAQPIPEGPVDDEAAWTRGSALFTSECASCHAGDALTNDETIDVGTGGAFQVPSLRGLAYRAPYLHDGSAATVADVLARHGAATLDDAARADLVAYARSL